MNGNIRRIGVWVAIVVLIGAAFGSGYVLAHYLKSPEVKGLGEGETIVSFIDGEGRTIKITETPQRIVSMASSSTEILYEIGCWDKIVGVDKYSDYPSDAENKTNVGSCYSPSLEIIIGLNPDLVIAWWYGRSSIESLEEETTVMYINPESVDDVMDLIKLYGLIMNKTSESDSLVDEMENRIDNVTDLVEGLNKTERPLVYYELSKKGRSTGQGTFTNELIFMAGGINIAADEPLRYPDLTDEYIIAKNPDVIVVVSYGAAVDEIKNRDGWENISAVKNNRVYSVDTHLVTSSPRLVDGLEQFARWFHPGLFVE
ncbi:MAG: helical backbone metal receptor [Thermoplasmatales archaeon]|nr:helical backbone metal receptor [Thermoplasmatales archaeon]